MAFLKREPIWVDRHAPVALAGLCAFYAAVALPQSLLKLLWADELITFYVSRRPGINGIWRALEAGADPNPPLTHLLVKASTSVFGDHGLAIRTPGLLCGLLTIFAMWSILCRYVRPVSAVIGILAWMCTRGFDYVYDARSYPLLMGFSMLSLACWLWSRNASSPWARLAACCGMALAIAAGLSSNYYGVLAFFPIAAGELTDFRQTRCLRAGTWIAMLLASLPMLVYLPLIRHNIAEFAPHAWNRPQWSMIGLSYVELVEGIFWPVLALGVFACWKRRAARTAPTPELAALLVLLLYPFLGFALAIGGAGMISARCVIPVCCGIGLAAGLLAQSTFSAAPGTGPGISPASALHTLPRRLSFRVDRAAWAIVLVLASWITIRESFCADILQQQRDAFLSLTYEIAQSSPRPIWLSDSAFALPLYFYSDPPARSRIVFPIDFEAIHRFSKEDSGEQNLWAGREHVFPFPIVPLESLSLSTHPILIADPDGWLAKSLAPTHLGLWKQGEQEVYWSLYWLNLGGVFTPMAHPQTRILEARKSNPN